jgi:hypothetical protein
MVSVSREPANPGEDLEASIDPLTSGQARSASRILSRRPHDQGGERVVDPWTTGLFG